MEFDWKISVRGDKRKGGALRWGEKNSERERVIKSLNFVGWIR